jgi:hypothetical protein
MLIESKFQREDCTRAQNHNIADRRIGLGKLAQHKLLAACPDCSEIDRHLLLNIHSLVLSVVDKKDVIHGRTTDLYRPAPVEFRNPWVPTPKFS